ncbi:hypothetical protein L7F22_049017 [Adiantum nelumboides]|nr:hypothetical protein [Adiantum nelumboides]
MVSLTEKDAAEGYTLGNIAPKDKDNLEEDDDGEPQNDDPATPKKPRVVWSVDLHQKFVNAVNRLGIDKAVPKRILELMNVRGLTRENVASHLEKYRVYLKRLSGAAYQGGGGLGEGFFGTPDERMSPNSVDPIFPGQLATIQGISSAYASRQRMGPDNGREREFPAGLRVLVVDDDRTSLLILDRLLRQCLYRVTTCERQSMH